MFLKELSISGRMWRILIQCLVLLTLLSCSKEAAFPEAGRSGEYVVVAVSSMSPEIPKYLTYRYKGKNINFFVIKIHNDVLSFLDACASCYPQKKGFRFEEGYFICRSCNVRYSVSDLEKGIGGCFPIRIGGSLRDGKYLILASTLEGFAGKF